MRHHRFQPQRGVGFHAFGQRLGMPVADALARHAGIDFEMHGKLPRANALPPRRLLEPVQMLRLPHDRRQAMLDDGFRLTGPDARHDQDPRLGTN